MRIAGVISLIVALSIGVFSVFMYLSLSNKRKKEKEESDKEKKNPKEDDDELEETTNPDIGGGPSNTSKYKSCPTIISGDNVTCEWKNHTTFDKDGSCFARYRDSPRCGESEAKVQCSKFGTWVNDKHLYLCKPN